MFHGPAVDGILDEAHCNAKFGTSSPNLKAIAEMKKRGVEFFVCGRNLAAEKIEPKTLLPEVTLAADALLVLIRYQNNGYALVKLLKLLVLADRRLTRAKRAARLPRSWEGRIRPTANTSSGAKVALLDLAYARR